MVDIHDRILLYLLQRKANSYLYPWASSTALAITSSAGDIINEGLVFVFENVKKGTTVKILVSDFLRCRLGLDGSEIMVRVE